jgi:hypothetical protein
MSARRLSFYLLLGALVLVLAGIPFRSQLSGQNGATVGLIAGRNVNMVAGTDFLTGDPYLQRQNEPSVAVSTRNPLHLLAGANDYRTVDMEIVSEELPGVQQGVANAPDAWLGLFKSFDGGESWTSKLLPGSLVDASMESLSSPIHGYEAAADPVVRAGANGLFFYSGIAFNRLQRGLGALFVARFIDNNNKETGDPIEYLDTKILDVGNPGHFIDKPWLAVDVPRTTELITLSNGAVVPRATVFVVYTSFMGNTEGDVHGKLMITMSRDCGQTWDTPTQITDAGQPYQAATVAIDPRNGKLYIAYRRFGKYGSTNAIMMLMEKDPKEVTDIGYTHEKLKFSKPIVVAEINPFDQPTLDTMFRTNTYPTMTIDNNGIIYLAWSQRNLLNYARIVLRTYNPGTGLWYGPYPVSDEANESTVWGHQFMPALSYAAGKVTLVWYDQRYDMSDVASYYIDDTAPNLWRHNIDVRATQFKPGAIPTIPKSIQVSKYPWLLYLNGANGNEPGTELWAKQLLYNKPNLDLFLHGTRAFIGDYIDLSPSPPFVPNGNGWKYNTEDVKNPVFHAVWGDNRDVMESSDWINYFHPFIDGDQNCSQKNQTGIRNQNIYTSRLSRGIIAGSPGNTKPLNTKRAFVVSIKNTTENERNLHLTISSSGPTAKFQEKGVESDSLDIIVPPFSTTSVTVSVYQYGNPYASVTVNISEGGILLAKVILNPDSTNPEIEDPDVDYPVPHVAALNETHTPHVAAYEVIEWDYESANPHVAAPHVAAPHVAAECVNDDWVTPHVAAPHVAAPHVAAPHVAATNIINPHVAATNFSADDMTEDSSLTDVYYGVDNVGNTTSSFSIGTLPVSLPEGIFVQMLIYRVYTTPSAVGCELVQQEHHELLSNITPHVAAVSPSGTSGNLRVNNISENIPVDATAVIPPGGRVIVMYRILDRDKYDENKVDPTSFVPEIKQDAKDIINGQEQQGPPPPALVITTAALNKGYIDLPFSQTLTAEGGYPPYTWSLVTNPTWMNIDSETGEIGGTPTAPEGIFDVTVEVKDSPPEGIIQQVTPKAFKITVAYPPDLIVESLTHDPEFPNTADEITFTAVVKNQGLGSAGPSTLEFRIGGEIPGAEGTQFSVPSLAPGAIYTVQRQKTLDVAQNYQNTATADIDNVVVESDETNNVTIDTFPVIVADVTPPTVSALSPPDDALGVGLNANLVITFSENVVVGSGYIVIHRSSDDTTFETIDVTDTSKVSISNNIVTINPAGTFESLTGYYVRVQGGGFKDTAGNLFAGILDETTWNFLTASYGNFNGTGGMAEARRDHTATLLTNGKVLIVGWFTQKAELYNPATGTFTYTAGETMFSHGQGASASRLQDGRVLIVGGNAAQTSAEIYDPANEMFTATGSLNNVHCYHTATLLPSGKVLIAAGQDNTGPQTHKIAELYDPAGGTFTLTGSLNVDRSGHTATLLSNGKVLIAGGGQTTTPGSAIMLDSAELYDPATGSFSLTGNLTKVRDGHTATLLLNGKVLIAGGNDKSAELYDPVGGTFSPTAYEMNQRRTSHTATLLPNGHVLLAGGSIAGGPVTTNSTELYEPITGSFSSSSNMTTPRQEHTATLLSDGRVLLAGGYDGSANTNSAELFYVTLCYPNLPTPALIYTGKEDYTVGDTAYTRYRFEVTNSAEFPDELFAPAPYLPPCGGNTNSSRTWVEIYDDNGNPRYGFCALSSSSGLKSIWFGLPKGTAPPPYIYIEINDRLCNTVYTSNNAYIINP